MILLLAGSLAELQNEVNNETGYRAELENYATSHNMTISPLGLDSIDTIELESIIKEQMQRCKLGIHASLESDAELAL